MPKRPSTTARLKTPGEREHLHRHLTRALALRGCATCADVVRAGVSTAEESTASLVDFAECARREGVPALAERALRTAAELTLPTHLDTMAHASVLWVFVARTRLAQLLAETGRRDEALALFASVQQRWRNADRPLPILEEARRGLRQLRTR